MTKLSTPPVKKFCKNLEIYYVTNLFAALSSVYQSRVHDVEELLDIWHGFQQSAVDSAIDGERVFAPAYGLKEDILSCDNE